MCNKRLFWKRLKWKTANFKNHFANLFFIELDEEKLKRVGFKADRKFEVKLRKRGRSKAGNKEVRKRKMRDQAMRQSGHLEKHKAAKETKFKHQKAKDVLARFMKRDV